MVTGNLLPSVSDSVHGLEQSAAGLGAYISSYFESTKDLDEGPTV
jgi:hypothetical protein